MNVHPELARCLEVLIDLDRENVGSRVLPEHHLLVVREALKGVLVTRRNLEAHCRLLDAFLERPFRQVGQLPEHQVKAILDNGLESLSAEDVARLALNPVALCQLHLAINTDAGFVWSSVIDREGRALMRECMRED